MAARPDVRRAPWGQARSNLDLILFELLRLIASWMWQRFFVPENRTEIAHI
jgi:hypothetical protein